MGEYKRFLMKMSVDAMDEYEQMKDHCLISTIDRSAVSGKYLYNIYLECTIISKTFK